MTVKPLPPWAPAALAGALLGVATRFRGAELEQVFAFDWGSGVTALTAAGLEAADAARACTDPRALWVLPRTRFTYWDLINRCGASHWDGCEPCCIGVAWWPSAGPVLVYDRNQVISAFTNERVDSSVPVPRSHLRARAIDAFDQLAIYDLGPQTPFYL